MHRILNYKILAFASVLIWLLASWSGAHGHFCFDGQEPPVSIHMHVPSEYSDHNSDQNHLDADVDIGQLAPAKSLKLELPLLLAAAFLLVVFFYKAVQLPTHYLRFIPAPAADLRPPLRAPPAIPA